MRPVFPRRLAAILLCFSFPVFAFCLFAQGSQPTPDQKYLLDAANRERAVNGARPLRWDPALAFAAQQHVHEMVKHNVISHRFQGEPELKARVAAVGARFSAVAENVAEGPEISEIHINWMLSPGHRANILNPQLTAVGIAVEKRDEQYFAVQDFAAQVAAFSRDEQEKRIGALIASHGLKIARDPDAARAVCAKRGGTGGAHPRGVASFESPDLTTLPDGLLKMIREGGYSTAEVGACDAGDQGGFTTYRLAVLFF